MWNQTLSVMWFIIFHDLNMIYSHIWLMELNGPPISCNAVLTGNNMALKLSLWQIYGVRNSIYHRLSLHWGRSCRPNDMEKLSALLPPLPAEPTNDRWSPIEKGPVKQSFHDFRLLAWTTHEKSSRVSHDGRYDVRICFLEPDIMLSFVNVKLNLLAWYFFYHVTDVNK